MQNWEPIIFDEDEEKREIRRMEIGQYASGRFERSDVYS
jgi:hypothetical protein